MDSFKNFDFFRKIPEDLTRATRTGASLSFFGVFCLSTLFIFEFNSYLTTNVATEVVMDTSEDRYLRVNFNISLPRVPCQFASVDVQDVLKTRKHNITANIQKWRIDFEAGRRLEQVADKPAAPVYGKAVAVKGDERHSQELTGHDDFEVFVKGHDVALVNFYAPWCIWCKRLHPVWEEAAGKISTRYMRKVQFAKMDCTNKQNEKTCRANHITAFPTIIIYRNHKDHSHEHYHGDRTVNALSTEVEKIYGALVKAGTIKAAEEPKKALPSPTDGSGDGSEAAKKGPTKGTYPRAEGCQISGFLDLNKVPGSMFFTVESGGHSFDAKQVNLTHVVHKLSYGTPLTKYQRDRVPAATVAALGTLENQKFVSKVPQESHEHYIKVVGSQFQFMSGEQVNTYTYTENSHAYIDADNIAAAKFTYDLSPMSIVVREYRTPFYKFLTSVCAIIGGVFTVIGLFDSMVYHSLRTLKKKVELGKAS